MTPCRWRWRRCAPRRRARCSPRTTPWCSRCGPNAIVTCPGPVTRPPAGCTRCCGLVPGGIGEEITAAQAERILSQIRPAGAAARARRELAAEFLAGIRNLDAQRRETKKKLAAAVKASGTSLTGSVFGAGPVIAGMGDR